MNCFAVSKIGAFDFDTALDYLKTKSTAEAVFVYETILYNGIGNQLVYKDHHNLFRLLLKDPQRYKETILKIRHEMMNNLLLPTDYFINEYICCCIQWGEFDSALSILDECIKDQVCVSLQTWQELLKYHLASNDSEKWKNGILLYEKIANSTPTVRPSSQIYIQIMNLFTKLGQKEKVKNLFFEAEDNLERLVSVQAKRMKYEEEKELETWKANIHTQLFNAYLNSFLDDSQKVVKEYSAFAESGILKMAVKVAPNTFHLLFKSLQFIDSSVERGVFLKIYRDEMIKNNVKANYLHYSVMIEYASDVEEMKSLYKNATTNGGAHIPPSKLSHLDTSFISALTSLDPNHGLEALQQVHHRNQQGIEMKKPMRFVYQ